MLCMRGVSVWSRLFVMASELSREGGGLETDVGAVMLLASSATSIHIRLADQEHHSVTLKSGAEARWPLERLARGLPFDVTDSGGDVTRELAERTWSGSRVKAMVARGPCQGHDRRRRRGSRRSRDRAARGGW